MEKLESRHINKIWTKCWLADWIALKTYIKYCSTMSVQKQELYYRDEHHSSYRYPPFPSLSLFVFILYIPPLPSLFFRSFYLSLLSLCVSSCHSFWSPAALWAENKTLTYSTYDPRTVCACVWIYSVFLLSVGVYHLSVFMCVCVGVYSSIMVLFTRPGGLRLTLIFGSWKPFAQK